VGLFDSYFLNQLIFIQLILAAVEISVSHTHVPNHQLDFPVLLLIIYISLGTDDYDDEYCQSFFLPTVGTMGNEKTSGWARQSSFSSNG
jgi:hypothetical protein